MNEGWHSDPEFEYEYPKYDNGTAILQRMNRAKPRIRNISNFRNSLTMNIDSRKVGKLIGKGGCNIKELEEKSKARIKVSIISILTHCMWVYFISDLRMQRVFFHKKKKEKKQKKRMVFLGRNNKICCLATTNTISAVPIAFK